MKGKRLPGHKGAQRVTVRNVKVADIKPDKNILLLKGSVPGKSGGLVIIRKNE
jgi:large subunit ribosomal protein L3